jgi:hypothetical protein
MLVEKTYLICLPIFEAAFRGANAGNMGSSCRTIIVGGLGIFLRMRCQPSSMAQLP